MDANPFSPSPNADQRGQAGPPYVGALLRLCWRRVRDHLHEAIRAAGFTDLQDSHLAVFSYPLPDGVRPSELGRRIGMSRQATNHIISQMEAMGYVERRASRPGERRLVHLTDRGWQVSEAIFATLADLQERWAEEIGRARFTEFLDVLRSLAGETRRE